jgi:hypothetical protein
VIGTSFEGKVDAAGGVVAADAAWVLEWRAKSVKRPG